MILTSYRSILLLNSLSTSVEKNQGAVIERVRAEILVENTG
jgi:hypothetical protein